MRQQGLSLFRINYGCGLPTLSFTACHGLCNLIHPRLPSSSASVRKASKKDSRQSNGMRARRNRTDLRFPPRRNQRDPRPPGRPLDPARFEEANSFRLGYGSYYAQPRSVAAEKENLVIVGGLHRWGHGDPGSVLPIIPSGTNNGRCQKVSCHGVRLYFSEYVVVIRVLMQVSTSGGDTASNPLPRYL